MGLGIRHVNTIRSWQLTPKAWLSRFVACPEPVDRVCGKSGSTGVLVESESSGRG